MKKLVSLLVSIFIICICISASCEKLTLYGGTFPQSNNGYKEFRKDHPDIELLYSNVSYYPSSAFITALLTGEFQCDAFLQGTNQAEWHALMYKGYCYDLSDSEILSDAISRMHPSIAAQATYEGHIYAIPKSINFIYYQINRDTWIRAGFTLDEVPQTFPQLLDFLSMWCDRIEDNPEDEIATFGGWDDTSYSSAVYINMLTEMLVNQITVQKQYENKILEFNNEETLELLERCSEIGTRLYELESKSYNSTLFEYVSCGIWPKSTADIVFLCLHNSDPKIIKSVLTMWAVMPKSKHISTSIELLEKAAVGTTDPSTCDDLFLYVDSEPRINPDYESDLEYWTQRRDMILEKLKSEDLDPEDRMALEEKLESYSNNIIWVEDNKWIVSPDELSNYKEMASYLYFPPINVFTQAAEGYDQLWQLINQFGYKQISAYEMMTRLDTIATMMRLENEI